MALRATPTIAICLTAGVAAGIALARPADQAAPAPVAAAVTESTPAASGRVAEADADSPYLADGAPEAVGDSEPAATPTPAAAPTSIAIEGFAFAPSAAVAAGSPIEVINLDSAAHTLTATGGEFDTGSLGRDQVASFAAPSAPGSYEFFCAIHPSMTGALVVS